MAVTISGTTGVETPGIVSSGAVSGTTGTFTGNVSGVNGTFTGNVQMPSQNGGQLAGLRNKIINGDMNINQRNATAQALTNPGAYSLDRWYGRCTGTASGTITIGQQGYVINVGSSNQLLRLAKTAGTYAGTLYVAQAFETANSYGLAGKQVTISFRARSGATYTGASLPTATIVTGTGTNQSPELMITGGWTGSVSQGVTLTGTLGATMSTFSGTVTLASGISQVGVLLGSVYTGTTGSTNDYLDITDVQLEVGPVATPFEQRPIGMELALCQRYYYRATAGSIANERLFPSGVVVTTTRCQAYIRYPVTMRATPFAAGVGNATNLVVWAGGTNYVVTSTTAAETAYEGTNWAFDVTGPMPLGYATQITRSATATPAPYFEASAEL